MYFELPCVDFHHLSIIQQHLKAKLKVFFSFRNSLLFEFPSLSGERFQGIGLPTITYKFASSISYGQ